MKKLLWLMILTATSPAFAGSVPAVITYQGTLKESGSPVTGSRNMQFSITSADGSIVYWTGGTIPVNVTNGLFSVLLSPTGVNWQYVTPYLEVSINGQSLSPLEPITANAYALMSGGVIDGSITTASIATGAVTVAQLDPSVSAYLVPSGAVMLFTTNCPNGWVRLSALDNLFPMGGASYGTTGGSATHSHTLIEGTKVSAGPSNTVGVGSPGGVMGSYAGGSGYPLYPTQDTTTSASNLPPYMTMVYCQKT